MNYIGDRDTQPTSTTRQLVKQVERLQDSVRDLRYCVIVLILGFVVMVVGLATLEHVRPEYQPHHKQPRGLHDRAD